VTLLATALLVLFLAAVWAVVLVFSLPWWIGASVTLLTATTAIAVLACWAVAGTALIMIAARQDRSAPA